MKAKLMALVLAAGLGITGIAATAQAAEAKALNTCAHTGQIAVFTEILEAVSWGEDHYVERKYTYYCSVCESEISIDYDATYEPHDYEQIYFENGSVMSYCTVCDVRYFW